MTAMPNDHDPTAIILIDHGSRRAESNDQLFEVVEAYRRHSGCSIVEPAHMELAEPSLATAFARAVDRGARRVIVVPYFLAPGRHWQEDIPRLAAEAAAPFPAVEWVVAAPLGLHPKMLEVIDDRIGEALGRKHLADS
jgi:sirohydrochlorin ferrochelatase